MQPAVDKEGYLLDLDDWTESAAEMLARAEGIDLTPEHWTVIHIVREFYVTYQLAPAMRPLVKLIRERVGPDKGNSIYLMTLFPGSPAKVLARIAGLPRPTNCL
ncbi:MAG: TusE/DsrC/DsvC family sulfur relay protein [Pseudomonadales bacterium]